MTTPPDIAAVAGKLTKLARDQLASIHPRFGVKDIWRPEEGESHAPYTAMVRLGILGKERSGDFPTVYWLTELGVQVKAHLLENGGG